MLCFFVFICLIGFYRGYNDYSLLSWLDVVDGTHQNLPGVAIAGKDTRDVHLSRGHDVASEISVGAGAEYDVAATQPLEAAVGAVGGQCHAAVGRSKDTLAISTRDFHATDGHQATAVLSQIAFVFHPVDIKFNGSDSSGVGLAKDFVVVVPDEAIHTAYIGGATGTCVGHTKFTLRAIAADVEVFQVDEHLLANGHIAVDTALCDADNESTGAIVDNQLIVYITLNVVANDGAFDLNVLGHLLHATVADYGSKLRLELGNRNHIRLGEGIIAIGRKTGVLRGVETVSHARCKQCAYERDDDIFKLSHIVGILESEGEVKHSVDAECVVFLGIQRELVGTLVVHRTIALHGVVATALLIATGAEVALIEDVGHHQVDRQLLAALHTDALTNRAVKHKATLALRLIGNNEVALVIHAAHCGECTTVT